MGSKALGATALLSLTTYAMANCYSACSAAGSQARTAAYNSVYWSGFTQCSSISNQAGYTACVAGLNSAATQAGNAAYTSAYDSCMSSC